MKWHMFGNKYSYAFLMIRTRHDFLYVHAAYLQPIYSSVYAQLNGFTEVA